jgi:hypothetical protein
VRVGMMQVRTFSALVCGRWSEDGGAFALGSSRNKMIRDADMASRWGTKTPQQWMLGSSLIARSIHLDTVWA